ncbi:uncharacterized protein LOC134270875 [Saccostrea cucullata]|uniref:uncharacterized protein LOC134270875 n=1 Tax=Saccostrea cuccullata TaxID=36930 RepID=UPI002ED5CF4C
MTGKSDTALVIENVAFSNIDSWFPCKCNSLTVTYNKTGGSPVQNLAFITLSYINSFAHENSRSVSLIVCLRIDPGRARFGETYVFSAVHVTDKSISKINFTISKPEIFHDKRGDVLSMFNNMLDGNETTCLKLPVQGEIPPLFWVKMKTSWLNISSTEHNITVIGVHISCRPQGERVLQVSFPTESSKSGFQGEVEFCNLTFEDISSEGNLTKCVYNCKCKSVLECGELLLFMAKHDILEWSLCEVYAKNIK